MHLRHSLPDVGYRLEFGSSPALCALANTATAADGIFCGVKPKGAQTVLGRPEVPRGSGGHRLAFSSSWIAGLLCRFADQRFREAPGAWRPERARSFGPPGHCRAAVHVSRVGVADVNHRSSRIKNPPGGQRAGRLQAAARVRFDRSQSARSTDPKPPLSLRAGAVVKRDRAPPALERRRDRSRKPLHGPALRDPATWGGGCRRRARARRRRVGGSRLRHDACRRPAAPVAVLRRQDSDASGRAGRGCRSAWAVRNLARQDIPLGPRSGQPASL